MLFGPIFSVDLVTSARRVRHFAVRGLYALVLFIALVIIYSSSRPHYDISEIHAVAALAATFFATFSVLQILAVLLVGPALVVGTIATERERRTIEYLFASQLNNAEIVLGKLAARLLHVVFVVMAGLPVLSLAMMMGGIAPYLLTMVFVIAVSSVVAVAGLSIAVSVWSPRARDAVTRVYLILFAAIVIPFLALQWIDNSGSFLAVDLTRLAVELVNPIYVTVVVQGMAATSGPSAAWEMVWRMVAFQSLFSVACVVLATWSVRRVHVRAAGRSPRWINFRFPAWRPRLGDSPILWKELFVERAGGRLGVVATIAKLLIVAGSLFWIGSAGYNAMFTDYSFDPWGPDWRAARYLGNTMVLCALLSCGGLLLLGARSACAISSEKERDCWTSLLATPLSPREIVIGKILGNLYAMRGLLLLLAAAWSVAALLDPRFVLAVPFLIAILAIMGLFASALGVKLSLACKTSLRAMAGTVAIGLFVGGGYMFCCIPFMFAGAGDGWELILAGCVPFLVIYPEGAYVESTSLYGRSSGLGGEMLAAFLIGSAGYLIAGLALAGSAIGNFERLTGRVHSSWARRRHDRPAGSPPAGVEPPLAEVVEEQPGTDQPDGIITAEWIDEDEGPR